jgi:hypothetical protein
MKVRRCYGWDSDALYITGDQQPAPLAPQVVGVSSCKKKKTEGNAKVKSIGWLAAGKNS